jgi:ADP-ribosylation factor GTPase-activating protein 1
LAGVVQRCADCKAFFPQWAGVSFGVLLCLACAGQHRALGVRVNVVKSLTMDSWTPSEQRRLEVGGNAKWTAVCAGTATSELSIADKYQSSIATIYRGR